MQVYVDTSKYLSKLYNYIYTSISIFIYIDQLERERIYKKLAHVILEVESSKSVGYANRLEIQGRAYGVA